MPILTSNNGDIDYIKLSWMEAIAFSESKNLSEDIFRAYGRLLKDAPEILFVGYYSEENIPEVTLLKGDSILPFKEFLNEEFPKWKIRLAGTVV
jgi:hypothetical protein